ncbi:MAG: ABC transporter ATP-binding protein YtrE [Chlamydiia bacterium]|nr:ABC transporter ATP-binding protein YtrE [Chlamydiia bacterium]
MFESIELNQVKKVYKSSQEIPAVNGVSLTLEKGELLMLIGPSGSGKTTLCQIIGGQLSPTEGSCKILGEDLFAMGKEDRSRFIAENMGFVFQGFHLIPHLSILENVGIPLRINGCPHEEIEERVIPILDQFGIADKKDLYPNMLCIGQMQLACIARALVHQPEVLVMDEPLSALDHQLAVKVLTTLRSAVIDERKTLLMVAHDARIHPFAHRLAKMREGEIVDVMGETLPDEMPPPYMRI